MYDTVVQKKYNMSKIMSKNGYLDRVCMIQSVQKSLHWKSMHDKVCPKMVTLVEYVQNLLADICEAAVDIARNVDFGNEAQRAVNVRQGQLQLPE